MEEKAFYILNYRDIKKNFCVNYFSIKIVQQEMEVHLCTEI